MNLKDAWKRYSVGDRVTDEELDAMIVEAEAAMTYLCNRLPEYTLAVKDTALTLAQLKSYQRARKERP